MIRVVVVDDQALVRGAFTVLVDSAPDLTTVGEAADGAEAVAVVARTRPDVVLMDIRMPVMDGLAATRAILAHDAAVRVLVLTTFDLDSYVYDALRAGASGFLLKDARPTDLLDAVRVVAAGEALLAPRATRLLVEQFVALPGPGTAVPGDLPGDRPGARGAAPDRAGNVERRDHRSAGGQPGHQKTHVSHLLAKLAARDRAQLVVAAYTSGLMGPTGG